MTTAYTKLAAANSSTDASSYTFSSQAIGSNADIPKIVRVTARGNSANKGRVASVTIGGVPLTKVVDVMTDGGNTPSTTAAIFVGRVRLTGSQNVIVTFTSTGVLGGTAATQLRAAIEVGEADIDMKAIDTATGSAGSSTNNAAASIDTVTGGLLVGVAAIGTGVLGSPHTFTGVDTQDTSVLVETGMGFVSAHKDNTSNASNVSVNMSLATTGSIDDYSSAYASFAPARTFDWTPADDASRVREFDLSAEARVTRTGVLISAVADSEGNTAISQATSGNQPDWVAGPNGMPAGDFAGSSGDLLNNTSQTITSTNLMVVVVGRINSGASDLGRLVELPGTVPVVAYIDDANGTSGANRALTLQKNGQGDSDSSVIITEGSWFIYTGTVEPTELNAYLNGQLTPETQTGLTSTTPNINAISIGNRAAKDRRYQGLIAYVAISTDISDDNRQKYEGYLAHRYGLENLLPSGHTWKASPPTDTAGPATGTLAVTADDATVSAAAKALAKATFSITTDNATVSATGAAKALGAINVTTDDATVAGTSVAKATGSLGLTLADATMVSEGEILPPLPSHGDLNLTLADATLAATGAARALAAFSITTDNATVAATGAARAVGALAVTLDDATISSGASSPAVATLDVQLADATISAEGKARVTGTADLTTDDAECQAITGVLGSFAKQTEDAWLLATGRVRAIGGIDVQLDDATMHSDAQGQVRAILSVTTDNATMFAYGGAPSRGEINITLDDSTVSGAGVVKVVASLDVTLDDAIMTARLEAVLTPNEARVARASHEPRIAFARHEPRVARAPHELRLARVLPG